MQPLDLLLLALATYTVTDILVNRGLPFNVLGRLRDSHDWQLLRCFYCSAFWAGIAIYLVWLLNPQVVAPLALSGGAILLWRYTGGNHV
jgi:hypothetical protein